MDARFVLTDLPGPGPSQRVRVTLAQTDDGRLTINLHEQHHAEGIGWFDQRSISLEASQLQRLQAVLEMKAVAWDHPDEPPSTLPFPGPALFDPDCPAVLEKA